MYQHHGRNVIGARNCLPTFSPKRLHATLKNHKIKKIRLDFVS